MNAAWPSPLSASVQSVVVLRALMLGDLLCATPALRALRRGLPGARITLVGLPWAAELAERLDSIDEFIEFPGWPGLPERPAPTVSEMTTFCTRMRARRFDLAVQMHGSGDIVNPLVASWGARLLAGFAAAGAWRPADDAGRFIGWPEQGSEVDRLLALTDALGMPPQRRQLEFPLFRADRRHAEALRGTAARGGYVIVHPGSQLPSRRWPVERFAAVADALAERGLAVLLTGTAPEAPLCAAVAATMRHPARSLAGRTGLWTLGALVEGAALVLANDTGLSHIAAALGTPSVIVANGSDVARWAPADGARHRVLWQPMPCRPCGHAICPEALPCALRVPVPPVHAAALQLLEPRHA